jgi:hypothetical protein
MADEPEGTFDKFEAEARAYTAGKNRERTSETRMGSTRQSRPGVERGDNPLKAHQRHRQESAAGHKAQLQTIADPARRAEIGAQIDEHYKAWGKALFKAHNQRYDNSNTIYERKLTERKIDQRLIPKDQKETMRTDAIREAVAQSNNRIAEINGSLPRIIDRTIGDAVKSTPEARRTPLDKDTQRAKDAAATVKARALQNGHDRSDRDRER